MRRGSLRHNVQYLDLSLSSKSAYRIAVHTQLEWGTDLGVGAALTFDVGAGQKICPAFICDTMLCSAIIYPEGMIGTDREMLFVQQLSICAKGS